MIIRRAYKKDLDALVELSASISSGMTSMPADRQSWQKKLDLVDASYQDTCLEHNEHIYFLILEDPETGKIVGSCGVHTGIGSNKPFYNYRLSKLVNSSETLDITVVSNCLNLANDFTGATELVSLYLKPEYRRDKLGQALSRSRFMLMHNFSERFGDTVFAELRGWLDEQDRSPFWESVGRKFFKIPFDKADFISGVNGHQFISDLMPKLPIYLELLPDEAREVIGKPHDHTRPAMSLLEKEGFSWQNSVDIFDAGPVVQCQKDQIKSIQQIKEALLESTFQQFPEEGAIAQYCMVSNGSLENFRVVPTQVHTSSKGVQISTQAAELLQVKAGSPLYILEIV
ncbi:arginine N-succinyltransferase [Marinomonas sp. C2222]|uniref:Arginine N-succinyltransferase n=1 Tax=Marinomonas sargassi TaxID=2984494 RepID=A0ABT2YPL3_9GAMM|nr:arginine N-succinyltransferase [Marinomonas sargassi]MCV2401831.1 arginine N-succinyltransferase [Marinomonas sargassi]